MWAWTLIDDRAVDDINNSRVYFRTTVKATLSPLAPPISAVRDKASREGIVLTRRGMA